MKHSETFAKLSAALVAAQAQIKGVAKNSTNPHFKNKYASLDDIVAAVRPVLASHKLALVQGACDPIIDHGGSLEGFSVETMLIHESGEWIANAAIVPLTKVDAQGAGGAMTYGRRYGLSALLSLATDEDDDGQRGSKTQRQRALKESRESQQANDSGAVAHGARRSVRGSPRSTVRSRSSSSTVPAAP